MKVEKFCWIGRGTRDDFVKMPFQHVATLCNTGMKGREREGYRLIRKDGIGSPKGNGWRRRTESRVSKTVTRSGKAVV